MLPKAAPAPTRRSSPRHLQHRSPLQRPATQLLQGEIRIAERKALHGGGKAHARGESEEFLPVGAGEIRDRRHRTLAPQQPVRKRRHIAHVNAGAYHAPAWTYAGERGGNERADGRKHNGGIEPLARPLVRAAGPHRAEFAREALAGCIPRAREREHAPALPPGQLGEQMRRGAEAIEAEVARLARDTVGAIADEPRAQQRRQFGGRRLARQRQTVARIGEHLLRVAPVAAVPREARLLTQILASGAAIFARAAGRTPPGHAHAIADAEPCDLRSEGSDDADDL